MAQQLSNIAPLTELDAINVVLQAAGQSPITQDALDTPATDDVQMAVNTFRSILAECLSEGWRFNTRYGVQVAPAGSYVWTDVNGGQVTTLNIFKRPATALTWLPTRTAGNDGIDLVEALSARYTESSAAVLVLADRTQNRDGLDQSLFPYLYLDLTLAVDFSSAPQTFRAFVTAAAANALVSDVNGEEKPSLARREERSYRALKVDQGITERVNLFDRDASAQRMFGYRGNPSGFSRTLYTQ